MLRTAVPYMVLFTMVSGARRRELFGMIAQTARVSQVVMQFGKVSNNIYILDYNPTTVTALQAFSVALTTFDGKLRI